MDLDLLSALNAARAARRACVLVTPLDGGLQRLVSDDEVAGDPLARELAAALAAGQSRLVEVRGRQVFLGVELPAPRLLLVGAVHISQALAPMALATGFDVTVLDPRAAFATIGRFGPVPVIAEWPDQALPGYGLDRFTAVAALTHDPRIDEPAIAEALAAGCFYVGALGSRRTHAQRLDRLARAGIGPASAERIHAPIGLDIGAASPAEIAVAILAELIAVHRRPAGQIESRRMAAGA